MIRKYNTLEVDHKWPKISPTMNRKQESIDLELTGLDHEGGFEAN